MSSRPCTTHLEEFAPRMAGHGLLEAGHGPSATIQGHVVCLDASHHGHLNKERLISSTRRAAAADHETTAATRMPTAMFEHPLASKQGRAREKEGQAVVEHVPSFSCRKKKSDTRAPKIGRQQLNKKPAPSGRPSETRCTPSAGLWVSPSVAYKIQNTKYVPSNSPSPSPSPPPPPPPTTTKACHLQLPFYPPYPSPSMNHLAKSGRQRTVLEGLLLLHEAVAQDVPVDHDSDMGHLA